MGNTFGTKRRVSTGPLKKRIAEERRTMYLEVITDAAERIFASKGMAGAHMQEIAAEADISLGTLYAAIDGKQSILSEILKVRLKGFLDCIQAARDLHDSTLGRHLSVVRAGTQYFLKNPNFLRMCCNDRSNWASSPSFSILKGELGPGGFASIPYQLFVCGISEGIYVNEDPGLLVRKMLALKQAELIYWLDHDMTTPDEVILERVESQFIRAFCIHPELVSQDR
ncbi:TetR/AcrR family transcriptional regulator [Denitratisoma oestradiolicum]|uniref:Uncharacterized protein n=1 Tax=Denitratisoma oestradiolicum TaxID=311182 RepID=A0A6S6XW64_9PROT|nr:TetR/AcrR family transcriptional regulator [Denitratisoma oestradiolicum]TWO79021.1 hypothetical protein CBW56_16995 [Denitratisoma oestradiolicum]CAB1368317.1 conserved protein of unknown function [Denitratisoma oestradiolicum]